MKCRDKIITLYFQIPWQQAEKNLDSAERLADFSLRSEKFSLERNLQNRKKRGYNLNEVTYIMSNTKCSRCLAEFALGQMPQGKPYRLGCKHIFCEGCFEEILSEIKDENLWCPLCR